VLERNTLTDTVKVVQPDCTAYIAPSVQSFSIHR